MFRDFSAVSWELLNQIFYFLAEVGGGGGGVEDEWLFFSWVMWDNCAQFNCDQLAMADKETKINVVFVKYI